MTMISTFLGGKKLGIITHIMETTDMNIKHSQNFLTSSNLISQLITKSSIDKTDTVIEIGAGTGNITEEIAKQCKQVIAIEIDQKLIDVLKVKFKDNSIVKIYSGDFLKYSLPSFPYKIFSNIPFNITADVLRKITHSSNPPRDCYLIVQSEAADKFSGQPYAKETLSSLLIKPTFEVSIVHQFRKTDFRPVPNVDIVLLKLSKRIVPVIETQNKQLFEDFISYVFSQWKPTVYDSLKKIFTNTQLLELSHSLRFSRNSTQTQIHFEQWLEIFNYFVVGVENSKKSQVFGFASKQKQSRHKLVKIHRTRTDTNWRLKKT